MTMNRATARLQSAQRGFSLVEIMVGVAIGLIGILVITSTYITHDNFTRSTLGEGGAQTNGTVALFTLERDVRMAGYGLNHSSVLGCGTLNWYYNGNYSPNLQGGSPLPALTVAPVYITQTAGAPDQITLMMSNDGFRMVPSTLTTTAPAGTGDLSVNGTVGFDTGDLLLLVPSAGGATCSMAQITNVAAASAKLSRASSALYNPSGASLLPSYVTNDLVFNLGTPTVRTYSISSNKLRVNDVLLTVAGGSATNIVDGIVDLKAEYGKDNGTDNGTVTSGSFVAGDGVIDQFSNTQPTTAAQWAQVLALRIAVLARIGSYEKPVGGVCTATTASPTYASGSKTLSVPEGLPSCYRYRVFETVIPLRNMLWLAS